MRKNFKARIVKVLVLAFIVTNLFSTVNVFTNAETVTSQKVKIMCVGDSITQGNNSFNLEYSYRYPLWKKLIDANRNFEFVGAYNTGFEGTPKYDAYKGQTFNNKHHAKWGWSIQAITADLDNSLKTPANVPDMAIIYLGTNNYVANETIESKVNAMRALVTKLRSANSNMTIYIGEPFQTWFGEMSKGYANLAAELNTVASPVITIPQVTGWVDDPSKPGTCTLDWVHTNTVGDEKLGQWVFNAIKDSIPTIDSTDPTTAPTTAPTVSPSTQPSEAPVIEKITVKAPSINVTKIKVKKKYSRNNLKISWKANKSQYYTVQMSKKKLSGFKKVKKYQKGMSSYTKKGLKAKNKYYFRVRTYKVVKGIKYYSKYSAVKGLKL